MFGLAALPYEVTANIVGRISFDDVFNLASTCRALRFLLQEESICKSIIQTKIPFSTEALTARTTADVDYSRILRRYAKRRHALRTAQPFTVATVGFCNTYIYHKGLLCYTLDDRLRILDLHQSSQDEIVISIPGLLNQALHEVDGHYSGVFQVLYCADYIISCLYKSSGPDSESYLIAFNARFRTIITVKELESSEKIFVRHNKQYLYFGTHSEIGSDGYRKWVVHGFDITTRQWFEQKVHFPDMVGAELGSTICFEFHNGYLYALSNQTSFEVEEIDWTSFYHVVRFPLASPCKDLLEKTENGVDMWRRQHQEGPIDDRWTSLRLDVDEETNELRIVESRKEWHLGASRSQRTFYTTPIRFPDPLELENEDIYGSAAVSSIYMQGSSSVAPSSPSPSPSASTTIPILPSASTSTAKSRAAHQNLANLPQGPLTRLLREGDHPLYIHPPPRSPHFTHPSNDSLSPPTFTLANSRLRTYHTSCSTFIDLVNDPLPSDWQNHQRLRLRVGGRRKLPTLYDEHGCLREPSEDLQTALGELYVDEQVRFWPPKEVGEEMDELLNPKGWEGGEVVGEWDERGMVFATGSGVGEKPRAIVYVGFDPSLKLEGVRAWEKGETIGVSGVMDMDLVKGGMKDKGKGKAVGVGGGGRKGWGWRERALYRDIGAGQFFGTVTEKI